MKKGEKGKQMGSVRSVLSVSQPKGGQNVFPMHFQVIPGTGGGWGNSLS